MKNNIRYLLLFILICTLLGVRSALAQDGTGSAWSEVVSSDGSINYGGMSDNGVVSQPADFMPTIPGVGQVNAEYHVYTTSSGNQVLMPSASTLFFMAMDGQSALYSNASMGTNIATGATSNDGSKLTGIALVGNVAGWLAGSAQLQNGGAYDQNFFNSMLSGKADVWQMLPSGITNLLGSFATQSVQDANLYSYMILIPPGACGGSPAGCTPEQLALLTPPPSTEAPPTEDVTDIGDCPGPLVIPGKISFGGEKTGPNYPLVVGQDPDKRGVDFEFFASVAPTRYITYTKVADIECEENSSGGCRPRIVGYHCEQHVQVFEECIASATGSARLSDTSRAWILDELSIRYPEAYLHHPSFGFSSGDCSWSDTEERVPVADPGYWDVSVRGSTSGTPVSGPRGFGGQVDTFQAWLKEIAIIK